MGTTVYFDGEGITETAGDDTPAGFAAATAEAAGKTILVKIG